jgi:polyphosphate glucokinase
MITLGIDVGGTGIKGAPVDTERGVLLQERFRLLTPQPATLQAVANCVGDVAAYFNWTERIGVGFPAAIRNGVALTAANIDPAWLGTDGKALFQAATRCPVKVINDADAAGLAEMRFGAGRDQRGVVMMITLGTGIGTALFNDGQLVPNTELGHIEIRGKDAERRASDAARLRKGWTWEEYAVRLDEYLHRIELLFWPDLFIIGGGGSKYFERFASLLTLNAPVVPATLLNEAGIVGAALAALA